MILREARKSPAFPPDFRKAKEFLMYTLQDFITDPPTAELRTLCCPQDVSSVFVNSISVQELPLDDFVGENEIVLSTAIGCLDNEAKFCQFVQIVKRSGAAALILTFRDPDYQLFGSVIRCAALIGLPLFSIPWEIRFSDVVRFTTRKIRDESLMAYKQVQDKLFTAYFTSQPLDAAAKIIFYFLGVPVAIVSKDLKIRGRYPDSAPGSEYEAVEIRINAFLWGYIYIYEPQTCAPLFANRELLEKYVSMPLSLWFNRENIENMTVMKLKNDFVWNLANHNYTSFPEMAQQGKKLGFNLCRPYMCIALRISPRDTENTVDEYSSDAASLTAAVEELILAAKKQLELSLMFADRGLSFMIFVEVSAGTAETTLERFVQSLDPQFTRLYPLLQLHWGASEVSREEVVSFDRLYQNACLALQYCVNSQSDKHVFTYKDSQFHQIVSELSGSDIIKAAADEALRPLLDYEKTSSTDLVRTLTEFIKNNYNTSMTARHLHLNRQSLLYRLKKIEALTGLSLNDRRDLLLLEIFTRIHSDY